jgi:L-lactate permease
VPVILVALLVVRGAPASFAAAPGATRRDRAALALFGATGLPIIVAVTALGVHAQIISSVHAAVLVAAGMLSVLLFPLAGMALHRRTVREPVLSEEG